MSVGFATDIDELTITMPVQPGDRGRVAHYIKKSDIIPGYLMGIEVEALCGKRWIPQHAPERFPVCQECKRIKDSFGDSSDS